MRPSTAHCLLLSLSLGASLAQAEEPAPAPIPAAQPSIAQATAELERRLPRWWSSRSRKSCPEAVAGYRRPARSPSFDSLAAAQSWAEADPYRAAGVYAEVVVKPFKKVLP